MMQENDAEFNDAGGVKMMQNLPQQLFLNDAGSVTYHNGVNVEPRNGVIAQLQITVYEIRHCFNCQ